MKKISGAKGRQTKLIAGLGFESIAVVNSLLLLEKLFQLIGNKLFGVLLERIYSLADD